MERKRVLIVDDDHFIRRAIRRTVERHGHECLEAAAGDEACEMALAEHPDLIVLDVMLPHLNGYEVSRTIKKEVRKGTFDKDIRILIVTARRTDSKEREEFLQTWSQADEFIYKPFDLEYVDSRITKALEEQEAKSNQTGTCRVELDNGAEVEHVEEVYPCD